MDRAQKAAAVADLKQTFSEVGVVVVTRNLGLTVAQSTQLRTKMREAGATYKVSKNKLAKIALDGTDYLSLGDMLTGPVGLATSVDPVAAAKVVPPVKAARAASVPPPPPASDSFPSQQVIPSPERAPRLRAFSRVGPSRDRTHRTPPLRARRKRPPLVAPAPQECGDTRQVLGRGFVPSGILPARNGSFSRGILPRPRSGSPKARSSTTSRRSTCLSPAPSSTSRHSCRTT